MTEEKKRSDIPVHMEIASLAEIPHYELPAGYRMRTMLPEEAPRWTEVQRAAETVLTIEDDLFMGQFGADVPAIEQRCFLLIDEHNQPVGTISAWYSENYKGTGQNWGRLHWFAIKPSHQHRGLARPMISYVMEKFAAWGHPVGLAGDLDLADSRAEALSRFRLRTGFDGTGARDSWARVREHLAHPALVDALGK